MPTLKYLIPRDELIEKGFLQPIKKGRPPLYATDEERKQAHKTQQKACVKRHAERVQEANRKLQQFLFQELRVEPE
jgi:hypothetical protein